MVVDVSNFEPNKRSLSPIRNNSEGCRCLHNQKSATNDNEHLDREEGLSSGASSYRKVKSSDENMLNMLSKVFQSTKKSIWSAVFSNYDRPVSHDFKPKEPSSSVPGTYDTMRSDLVGRLEDNVGLYVKKRQSSEYVMIPNKKRKPSDDREPLFETIGSKFHEKKEPELEDKLKNAITPELDNPAADPFKWDRGKSEYPLHTGPVQYGTAFYRRRSKIDSSSRLSIARQTSSNDSVPAISFLKMVYNGELRTNEAIENERRAQLQLLESSTRESKSLKKSIINLTEKIKEILIDRQPSVILDNDVKIISERKVDPLTLKRKEFYNQKLKFDRSLLTFEEEFKSYKKLIEERRRIQSEIRRKQRKLVPELPDDIVNDVKTVLKRNDKSILSKKNNLEVTVRDFKTLAPRRWLNDTIIEYFMKQIENNNAKVVAFNSFFYTNLSQNGYQGVRRWMKRKKVKINDLDKVFAPINLDQSHWTLGVIDIANKRVLYADSLSSSPSATSFAIMKDLQKYVIDESGGSLGADFELQHLVCPRQPNGYDCGVYVCINSLYISKDQDLKFDHDDATRMRLYIGSMILSDGK
ncbi:HGL020Wp [Eremothecium sinecaudum]|uniref:HGL020Wp n=1 Tax=Eremothecium sinecaudum TaxID=45286 RepID=A0A120K2Q9_9SACH|nr:HGL020Wp [Eremothecium sinecaudum]AMD22320.1 HGL020Wp [Eremothecium sinecaudum]